MPSFARHKPQAKSRTCEAILRYRSRLPTELRALHRIIADYERRYNFFHFDVAFPEARHGFDIVIGNPPWDKTKLADTDFFPRWQSDYRTLSASAKKKVQKNLLAKPHIQALYDAEGLRIQVLNEFYKSTFPLNAGAGDGNLFRFFVERNLALLALGGSLNYVLPSALMFEDGSMALRQHILSTQTVPFFYSFENNKGIFQDVHRSYKFALMQVQNRRPSPHAAIDTAFYVLDPEDLAPDRIAKRTVQYPLKSIETLSPAHGAMMELRSARDLPILTRCYNAFPPLSPQWLDFRNELHMTNDKDIFIEEHKPGLLPLYQGGMIWQFDDKYAEPEYWLNKKTFDEVLKTKELARMSSDCEFPRSDSNIYQSSIRYDRDYVRAGFRAIARDTDERTLIFTMIPRNCGAGNSIYIAIPKTYVRSTQTKVGTNDISPLRMLFAVAWFNSLPADWLARFMIQINVNRTYMFRLPIPQPTDEEIFANPDFRILAKNALLLTLANNWDSFEELAPLFNIKKQDLTDDAKSFDHLRFANDQIVARLYGITEDDLRYILQSFPVMKSKRPEYVALFGR